jgi:hypothetical protein
MDFVEQQTQNEHKISTDVSSSDYESLNKFKLIAMSSAPVIDPEDLGIKDEAYRKRLVMIPFKSKYDDSDSTSLEDTAYWRKHLDIPFQSNWPVQSTIEVIVDTEEPLVPGMIRAQPIIHRYEMSKEVEAEIRSTPYEFGYGKFSETVYYRTYSRLKEDGTKEDFPDTIIRVVKGIVSIAKDWKIRHGLEWDQVRWDDMAIRFGKAMLKMHFLPPGRGLWISGSEYSYKRGSVAFNNCGFCSLGEGIIKAASWTIDSLACGCGIGFDTFEKIEKNGTSEFSNFVRPGCYQCNSLRNFTDIHSSNCHCQKKIYKIHDSREGWVKSLYLLLESYFTGVMVYFDYSDLRAEGEPIKGFGGHSSGFDPLRILHERIRIFIECYMDVNIENFSRRSSTLRGGYNKEKRNADVAIITMTHKHIAIYPESNTVERPSLKYALDQLISMDPLTRSKKTYGASRLICDIFNAIGICIVAGNVRRSSEIALGAADDSEFRNLKNHELNPERSIISWMSNNTVCLDKTEDFELLPEIAERIKDNGEPGILNRINGTKYGRVGRKVPVGREAEEDKAIGVNPCCISGDSMIDTDEGLVCVRDLVGKKFKARFDYTNDVVERYSTDQGFWSNGIKEVFELKLKNGLSVKVTADHRISVADNKSSAGTRWVQLKNLDLDNDYIGTNENESCRIESIKFIGEEEVYDCTIPEMDSFYANGILVHNCEILLESYEYCNLAELFPSRCNNKEIEEAAYLATIYASTVALLSTHWTFSNKVIARNRRIGISMSGIVEDVARSSNTLFTKKSRFLYKHIRKTNKEYAEENGVPESIRVTTVKPSGTISQLAGVSSGIHHNTYKYCIRRIRMSSTIKLTEILKAAGYSHEIDQKAGEGTIIFSFPLHQGNARTAEEVSVWEQVSNLAMLQREFADNSVSCTLYFNPETEGHDLEHVLSHFAPVIKSLSALPHTKAGVYKQAPYEKITEEQYHSMVASLKPIDLSQMTEEAEGTRGCDGDVCDMNAYKLASNDSDSHKNKKARV